MNIKLSEKQNLIISRLIGENNELQKEIERNSLRQKELLEIILEYNNVSMSDVFQVGLENGILHLKLKEVE